MLLHLLVQARQTLNFNLSAMHVHHGLNPQADHWADFCLSLCQKYDVMCLVKRVKVDVESGLGIEASARAVRYHALFNPQLPRDNPNELNALPTLVVTAHHQDDQAETVLLMLARGAGVKGLAAIAFYDAENRLLRPLLDIPRKTLFDYATLQGLTWCEDDSNDNTAFDRNYVRHKVLPILIKRFPAIKTALARTASHMAEAQDLLNELAVMDAKDCIVKDTLSVEKLRLLSHARAKNLLRWWFAEYNIMMPTTEQLEGLLAQSLHAKADANIECILKTHDVDRVLVLKRYQAKLYLIPQPTLVDYDMVWNGETELKLPDGSVLRFVEGVGEGLALRFGIKRLRVTNKKQGERFKPVANRPTRTLKHLMQEAHLPPWQRAHLPLIYLDDALACVPGIGVDYTLKARSKELGLVVTWQP